MMRIRLSMAALFLVVVAAAVVPSSAAGAEDECNQRQKCAEQEVAKNPVKLAECKEDCAQQADFEVAMRGLGDCDEACKAKGGGEAAVGKCMEPCTAKVDVAAAALATRSCYRKCATVDPAGDVKACQAKCEATADKALDDGCFKKCVGEAGTDVARVFACNVACPFDTVANQIWLKKEATSR